jgi:hypothetical protein
VIFFSSSTKDSTEDYVPLGQCIVSAHRILLGHMDVIISRLDSSIVYIEPVPCEETALHEYWRPIASVSIAVSIDTVLGHNNIEALI